MFKKLLLLFIFILPIFFSVYHPSSAKVYNPFFDVKDFKIYYDWPNAEVLKELRTYDLVVIAPHAYSKEQIEYIQSTGTIVLGYISVMQLESWNTDFVANVRNSDYYYLNGQRLYIKEWDTYIMDITKSHYRELLLNQVSNDIISKGMDGVFFDTVADIDAKFHKMDEKQESLRQAYLKLIDSIKEQDPHILLMQNRGFETIKQASENHVDAILWEDLDKADLEDSRWGQKWLNYFKTKHKNRELAVLSVTPNKESTVYSKEFGFVAFQKDKEHYN